MRAKTLVLCLCAFLLVPQAARSESPSPAGEPACEKALRSRENDPRALSLSLYCLAERKDYARARKALAGPVYGKEEIVCAEIDLGMMMIGTAHKTKPPLADQSTRQGQNPKCSATPFFRRPNSL